MWLCEFPKFVRLEQTGFQTKNLYRVEHCRHHSDAEDHPRNTVQGVAIYGTVERKHVLMALCTLQFVHTHCTSDSDEYAKVAMFQQISLSLPVLADRPTTDVKIMRARPVL